MEKNITPINQLSWKDRLKSYKKHPGSFILLLLVGTSAVITVTVQASYHYVMLYKM